MNVDCQFSLKQDFDFRKCFNMGTFFYLFSCLVRLFNKISSSIEFFVHFLSNNAMLWSSLTKLHTLHNNTEENSLYKFVSANRRVQFYIRRLTIWFLEIKWASMQRNFPFSLLLESDVWWWWWWWRVVWADCGNKCGAVTGPGPYLRVWPGCHVSLVS